MLKPLLYINLGKENPVFTESNIRFQVEDRQWFPDSSYSQTQDNVFFYHFNPDFWRIGKHGRSTRLRIRQAINQLTNYTTDSRGYTDRVSLCFCDDETVYKLKILYPRKVMMDYQMYVKDNCSNQFGLYVRYICNLPIREQRSPSKISLEYNEWLAKRYS